MYVLDTNVLKAITAPIPHENVERWFRTIDETELYISVIAIVEQRKGIENKRKKRQITLANQLEQKLLRLISDFSDRILLIDAEIADAWGYMIAQKDLNVYDLSVAATAKIKNYTVVTRNLKDFIGRGVRLLDPYKEPPDIREIS